LPRIPEEQLLRTPLGGSNAQFNTRPAEMLVGEFITVTFAGTERKSPVGTNADNWYGLT
jgi:hypothetical protein